MLEILSGLEIKVPGIIVYSMQYNMMVILLLLIAP